jgi:hypothetical protein
MKKVKIFLASSAELDADKQSFEVLISRKNKDLHEKRIYLELTTWKDFISSMSEGRTQDEYNKYIRSSDICIFLFHTVLGRYTREEFDQAHEAFLQSPKGRKAPRIYTFFKTDSDEKAEITEFRKHIDSLDHFFDTYDNLDDLFVKFNRQLDKLENEGIILKPEKIDTPKIIKYAIYYYLLPLLVLGGAIATWYYFQPGQMTVKIKEVRSVPNLPFETGQISLTYGPKTETQEFTGEVFFNQIPSKYKHRLVKLNFTAQGFEPIDTTLKVSELVELPIKRDNSLGLVFGWVRDAVTNLPLKDVQVSLKDLKTTTDEDGRFCIEIPLKLQEEKIRVIASKDGYQLKDRTGNPSQTVEWQFILEK